MKETHPKPTQHTTSTHAPVANNEHSMDLPKKKKPVAKVLLIILLILILLAGSAYLGYWYRSNQAKKQADQLNQQISELQQQKKEAEDAKAKLQTELDELKATKSTTTTTTTTTGTAPTAAVKANIEDAIKSGNTAALEGYMANPVKVVIAASGGVGDKTPAQAVASLSYIDAGTDPWNFNLPAATLQSYRNGPYGQYFPTNAVVGKSANNYVISFSFNSAGKISTVFMAVNSDLLVN